MNDVTVAAGVVTGTAGDVTLTSQQHVAQLSSRCSDNGRVVEPDEGDDHSTGC